MAQGKATILVVDDETTVRVLLQRILEEAGYETLGASDGQEALDVLARNEVGVMLLDIRMPGLSGMEVLRAIPQAYPNTCVIMVSAVAESQMAVDAMEAGAYDYVTKPFKLDDLTWRVRNALERRKLALQQAEYLSGLEERVREESERLRGQVVSLVRDLAREYARGLGDKVARHARRMGGGNGGLSAGLHTPVASVEEFAEALLQAIEGDGNGAREDEGAGGSWRL